MHELRELANNKYFFYVIAKYILEKYKGFKSTSLTFSQFSFLATHFLK